MEKEIYAPGMRADIRGEEWIIKDILRHKDLDTYTLGCVGISPLVKDKERYFVTELEHPRVIDPAQVTLVPDDSPLHNKSLLYLESQWRQQLPTDDKLHIGYRAAMDVLEYQLEPAQMALLRPRQRILIADAVGLGKTLEAGILLSELIARGKGKRILVVTTKSMMAQFQKEMWNRFTIPLVRLDSEKIQKIRASLPSNYNPFYYYDKSIVSMDTIKQSAEYRKHLEGAYWDVIVIDEAQNVAERGVHQAQRARLAKTLATRSDSMIMLSATPHDGRAKSFASLMNMLDPTAIADPENYGPEDITGMFTRRFRKDIQDQTASGFLERAVTVEKHPATDAEEKAFDLLSNMYLQMDENKVKGPGRLFRTMLEKALFSSPDACSTSIQARLGKLEKKYSAEEMPDIETLKTFKEAVDAIGPVENSRYQGLLRLLRSEEYGWNPEDTKDRLVIFTERVPTMKFLETHLKEDLGLADDAVVTMDGGMSDLDQQRIVENFGLEKSPVRILVASDVASEGLNLHYLSHRLIHFDIPWSLMVFQQRNGRIDRYGQKKRPDIRYMTTQSANDDIGGDQRILEVLICKEEEVQKNIGDPAMISGKFTKQEEEEVVAAAMESNMDAAKFELTLGAPHDEDSEDSEDLWDDDDDTDDDLWKSINEQGAVLNKAQVVHDVTLFSDMEYLKKGLTYLNQSESYAVKDLKTMHGVDIRLTPDLRTRLAALLPPEAMPNGDVLRLSSDPQVCMREMQQSMQSVLAESTWPKTQYLWQLHPVFSWLNDRLSLEFGKEQAPIIGISQGMEHGETIFIMNGNIPNEKATPLVDAWFALEYRDGTYVRRLSMKEMVAKTGIGQEDMVNPGTLDEDIVCRAADLRQDAVAQAHRIMKEYDAEYKQRVYPVLEEEEARLDSLLDKRLALLDRPLQTATHDAGKKGREIENRKKSTEKLFEDTKERMHEQLKIGDNAYVRIVGVLAATC